jgi:hypothetical protein
MTKHLTVAELTRQARNILPHIPSPIFRSMLADSADRFDRRERDIARYGEPQLLATDTLIGNSALGFVYLADILKE